MTTSDLEKFYSLGNVEGLAFVDTNNVLVDNQMIVSGEVATILAQSFGSIFSGLAKARRPCKGFLIRTSKHQFLGVPVMTGLVILQLNPAEKIDAHFSEAISIVGSQTGHELADAGIQTQAQPANVQNFPQPARPGQAVAQPVQPAQASQPAQPVAAQPETVDPGQLAAIFQEYTVALGKTMARVAPQNVAKKLVKDAQATVLGANGVPSTKEQIIAIGQQAASLVPNAGRRKLVETELNLLAERFHLNS